MKKFLGLRKKKKDNSPPVTLEEATEKINRRGDIADEKIKRLEAELLLFKEQIKKTKPGSAQDNLKARALRVLKQKKMYEAQRDTLYNQSFKLERVSFATEGIKDAKETMAAMKAGSKDLQGTLKLLKIDDVDKLQDVITNIVEESNEMQDSIIQGNSAPDQLDEDDLLEELDELESHVKTQKCSVEESNTEPATRLKAPDLEQEESLHSAPTQQNGVPDTAQHTPQADPDNEPGVPVLPRSSIRM
ncbi:hypothetical protein KP509_19G030500 [Ceratopteris richardii]|uniref:Uncharacterized protein n=1 Tax=Ceratopteris richardii TaxID=49495 RepID=A0A8T2SM66_CERRI|nr:hypothetical protein KP509_19G030500 [Ceratopteris richardii]KAH7352115.1 hypothetical protein KP509_19G030500 [Ceratopteris richardii]